MRQFLAVDIPEPTRLRLEELRARSERSCAGWRWVRSEAIHLTLRFLGEVSEDRDEAAREAWQRAAEGVGPFAFLLEGIVCFPSRRNPRVLCVGARESGSSGRLVELAERVERAARNAGFTAERRPFRPHLTLARAARGKRPRMPSDLGYADPTPVEVSVLTLFRSDLHPTGARYTALATFPLLGQKARTAGERAED